MARRKKPSDVAVIGLGGFGGSVARRLERMGQSVLGIDQSAEKIKEIADELTHTMMLDATNEEALLEADVASFDTAIVAIGDDFEASALVTAHLRSLGVRQIIAQAKSVRHRDILSQIGATQVVIPEEDSGERLAEVLSGTAEMERLRLGADRSLARVPVPQSLVGEPVEASERSEVSVVMLQRAADLILNPAGDLGLERGAVALAPRRLPFAVRLVAGLGLMVAIGTLVLSLRGMTTTPLSLLDTSFMTTSAVTVTGLAVVPVSTSFTFLGQIVILLLAQMGGVGFMVMVVLALRLAGQRVSLVDRLALTSSIGLRDPRSVLQIMTRATLFILAVEGMGAVLLYLHWTARGIVLPGDAWFYAIFHSVKAFCNAGFDLFSGNTAYSGGIPVDPVTLVILGGLIIVGGLGIPVLADLLTRRRGPRLHLHTRLVLGSSLGLVLVGWAGLLFVEFRLSGVLSGESFVDRVVIAWFQSVAARTAGFASISDFGGLHSASLILLGGLMFVGSAPASMGGGITTGSFAVLALAVVSYATGRDGA